MMPEGWIMRRSASGSAAGRVQRCTRVPSMRDATAVQSAPVSGSARWTLPSETMRAVRSPSSAATGEPDNVSASCGGDRKSVGSGKSVSGRVDLGGRVRLKNTELQPKQYNNNQNQ